MQVPSWDRWTLIQAPTNKPGNCNQKWNTGNYTTSHSKTFRCFFIVANIIYILLRFVLPTVSHQSRQCWLVLSLVWFRTRSPTYATHFFKLHVRVCFLQLSSLQIKSLIWSPSILSLPHTPTTARKKIVKQTGDAVVTSAWLLDNTFWLLSKCACILLPWLFATNAVLSHRAA